MPSLSLLHLTSSPPPLPHLRVSDCTLDWHAAHQIWAFRFFSFCFSLNKTLKTSFSCGLCHENATAVSEYKIRVVTCGVCAHEHTCASISFWNNTDVSPPARPGSHLAVRPNLRGIRAANCFNLQLRLSACDQIFSSGKSVAQQGLKCKVRLRSVDFSGFHMWPLVWKSKGNGYKLP